jgi:hypothetical protein
LGSEFVAFAGDNGVCQVWDKATERVVDELGCGKGSLVCGVVGGEFCVCGTGGGGVFVWSLEDVRGRVGERGRFGEENLYSQRAEVYRDATGKGKKRKAKPKSKPKK